MATALASGMCLHVCLCGSNAVAAVAALILAGMGSGETAVPVCLATGQACPCKAVLQASPYLLSAINTTSAAVLLGVQHGAGARAAPIMRISLSQ